MLEFSYIIGFRKNSEERLENLKCVLDWLSNHKKDKNFEVIVVEQDEQKKINFENCKNIFIYNKGLYNRSWAFNVGALNSSSEILVFADSDLLMNWNNFENAIEHCKTFWEAINPKGITVLDLEDSKFNPDIKVNNFKFSIRKGCNFSGGIVIFRKQSFFNLLGWPEEFEGWGGEDDAMSYKITKILQNYKTINFPVYHLHHEIIGRGNNLNYNNNVDILKKIQRMSKEEILNYYKDKEIGNINKYS